MIYVGRTGENNRGTPYAVRGERAESYITPEIRETAMQLLSKSRKAANGSLLGGIPQVCVVDEGVEPVYIREEDEEKAMKLLEKDGGYQKEVAPTPRVIPTESTVGYVSPKAKEKAVELHAKTEQDEYNKKPKLVNGANPQFLVVRYGWYAFAFLLEEGDVRGPELNAKAIQICEAMLTLESDGEDKTLKYHTSYAQQAQRAYRSAHPDTKKALKKFITTR